MTHDALPQFGDIHDLLKTIPISESTARRMMACGKIPFVKLGRRTVFNLNEVARAIQS